MRLVVNGEPREVRARPGSSLLGVLRDELGLRGTKGGCGEGSCGVCTVLVGDRATLACSVAVDEVTAPVTTIEGLAPDDRLHPLQEAFLETEAMQCGYCTPGMIMAAAALLTTDPHPSESAIVSALAPNLCRCCTYPRIVRAVQHAAEASGNSDTEAARRRPAPDSGDDNVSPSRPAAPWDLVTPGERDYFTVLPDGLVVVVSAPPSAPGMWAPHGGAWLHVDRDGVVRAFTGKVEVGQGTRGALALLVSHELGVAYEDVRIVMGDTDICPFDIGTFGSLAMTTAGPAIRLAAAAAREHLLTLATAQFDVAIERLVLREGRVVDSAATVVVGIGDLVRDRRDVVGADWASPVPTTPMTHVRERPTSARDVATVTGTHRFPSDLTRPGMLHGAVLYPPVLGATMSHVDVGPARKLPDVTVVEQHDFVGVVAPDTARARSALALVRVEWELPPTIDEADLFDHLRNHPAEASGWEQASEETTGDVDAAWVGADIRIARTFSTAPLAHAPLETLAAVAEWDDDHLTVRTGTQLPFTTRWALADALGIDERLVRVIVPDTGGGFGGKQATSIATAAARLARAVERPVMVHHTREEEFTRGHVRPAAIIDAQVGATRDGTITAWDFTDINAGRAALDAPYEFHTVRTRYQPADSPLAQGPYRALAATANNFARETLINELATRLGHDPLELRLRHLRDERLATILREAAAHYGWTERPRSPGRGAGIACGLEKGGRVATCAEVREHTGTIGVTRIVTAFECGEIIDPENLRNQIEGATVMALGGALFEAVHFAAGRITNPSFSSYRVPRFTDVPPIEVLLIDRPDLPPAGAGETPMIAVAPAVADAIFHATRRRRHDLPLLG